MKKIDCYVKFKAVSLFDEDDPFDDRSIPSDKTALLLRYEDLLFRREELSGSHVESRVRLTDSDLRYVLPEHLCSPGEVERAVMLAAGDLFRRYGVVVTEAVETEPSFVPENQLSIFEKPQIAA